MRALARIPTDGRWVVLQGDLARALLPHLPRCGERPAIPSDLTVQVKQLSKARTKLALNRYRPPKPREMFRDLVNADGDVVFDVAAEEDEASTGWPYDTIARRATEENDDET